MVIFIPGRTNVRGGELTNSLTSYLQQHSLENRESSLAFELNRIWRNLVQLLTVYFIIHTQSGIVELDQSSSPHIYVSQGIFIMFIHFILNIDLLKCFSLKRILFFFSSK